MSADRSLGAVTFERHTATGKKAPDDQAQRCSATVWTGEEMDRGLADRVMCSSRAYSRLRFDFVTGRLTLIEDAACICYSAL